MEAQTATLVPQPPITTGVSSTVNSLVTATTGFFSAAWPVLVAAMLLILLAMVVLSFGTTATRRLVRFSGNEADFDRLRGAHLARQEHNRRHGFDD